MTELNLEEPFEQGEVEIPSTLPVLPLKETVIFPQSVSPLAIGQERSIRLVDDVLEGERMLALVTVKEGEGDQPGWTDLYEIGTAAIVHKMIRPTGRCASSSRVSTASGSSAASRTSRTWSASSRSSRTRSRRPPSWRPSHAACRPSSGA